MITHRLILTAALFLAIPAIGFTADDPYANLKQNAQDLVNKANGHSDSSSTYKVSAAKKAKAIPVYALPVAPNLKKVAETTKDFYAWYMDNLNAGIYPMESNRDGMKKYVTARLVNEVRYMTKGPDGLNGDYFVDAQEWDPKWEENVRVSKSMFEEGVVHEDVVLDGPKNPNHKIKVTMALEKNAWKIDRVESAK